MAEPQADLSSATMNDDEFLKRFEAADLPEVAWHHREHLRVAYLGWSAAVSQTSRSTTTGSPSTVAPPTLSNRDAAD